MDKATLTALRGRVFNRHHGDVPADAIYIGRGSPWGNPYKIGRDGTRDEVCNLFERNVLPKLDLTQLIGKDLVCFCAPARCHGHSILNALLSRGGSPNGE